MLLVVVVVVVVGGVIGEDDEIGVVTVDSTRCSKLINSDNINKFMIACILSYVQYVLLYILRCSGFYRKSNLSLILNSFSYERSKNQLKQNQLIIKSRSVNNKT